MPRKDALPYDRQGAVVIISCSSLHDWISLKVIEDPVSHPSVRFHTRTRMGSVIVFMQPLESNSARQHFAETVSLRETPINKSAQYVSKDAVKPLLANV